MLTVGSLFSGIGGIDYGLEQTRGFKVIWQIEIEPYCQKVLAKRWPDVDRFRDVRECGKQNLAPVDLICGGFPCQPHSVSGKRKASEDPRDLWPEFYRIICELRPKWILAENVPGLLSSEHGRFFGRILRNLAESGYNAEWQVLSAAAVGACHKRERVFLVAHAHGLRRDDRGNHRQRRHLQNNEQWNTAEICEKRGRLKSEPGQMGAIFPNAYSEGLEIGSCFGGNAQEELTAFERSHSTGSGIWSSEPDVGRMVHGVPSRVERLEHIDRIKALGNAVVPQVATYIGRRILSVYQEDTYVTP